LREKQGENAQKLQWKKPLAAVLWFCGRLEILEFSEIGIAGQREGVVFEIGSAC
jgi:hypothetical protein